MNKNIISVSSTTSVNTCAKKMLEDGISSIYCCGPAEAWRGYFNEV